MNALLTLFFFLNHSGLARSIYTYPEGPQLLYIHAKRHKDRLKTAAVSAGGTMVVVQASGVIRDTATIRLRVQLTPYRSCGRQIPLRSVMPLLHVEPAIKQRS